MWYRVTFFAIMDKNPDFPPPWENAKAFGNFSIAFCERVPATSLKANTMHSGVFVSRLSQAHI